MINDLFLNKIDYIINSINNNRNILENNESQTRWLLIDYFLIDVLGFNREDIFVEFDVEQDNRLSKYNKIDYAITLNNKIKIIIETKSLGSDLFSYKDQLKDYFNMIVKNNSYEQKELIGILTDGNTYLFYSDNLFKSYMDENPYLSVTINHSDEFELFKLKSYLKNNLNKIEIELNREKDVVDLYELNSLYRIDSVDNLLNNYKSLVKKDKIILEYVYFNNKRIEVRTFKSLYKHVLKYIVKNKPELLFEIIEEENESYVDGSVKNLKYYLTPKHAGMLEIKTNNGSVYTDINLSENIIISKIIHLLDKGEIGRFNLMCKFKKM